MWTSSTWPPGQSLTLPTPLPSLPFLLINRNQLAPSPGKTISQSPTQAIDYHQLLLICQVRQTCQACLVNFGNGSAPPASLNFLSIFFQSRADVGLDVEPCCEAIRSWSCAEAGRIKSEREAGPLITSWCLCPSLAPARGLHLG